MSDNTKAFPYEKGSYTLYSCATCPYAQRALRALQLANVPYKLVEIDLLNKPSWYHLVNPQLKVPTLRLPSGEILIESLVIAEFVADQFPEAQLLSTDAIERAQLRLFIELFSSRIIPAYYRLLRTADTAGQETEKQALLEGIWAVSKELETQWERKSGNGGPFWYGDRFAFAEIATVSFAGLFRVLERYRGFSVPETEEYAGFNRWFAAVSEHPGFTGVKPDDDKLIASYKRFLP
ncbi:hypothetical protein LPJ64_001643 [Coemansia asiatica]|uniref:Glutathione S-transferase n=1 Tax=Coemansia asiatica TaxID=1052880 RepID=A0A9W7XKX7_9FUNG|nr:hypothetical protein LPJ64_001643 [Coemansia asiatica]